MCVEAERARCFLSHTSRSFCCPNQWMWSASLIRLSEPSDPSTRSSIATGRLTQSSIHNEANLVITINNQSISLLSNTPRPQQPIQNWSWSIVLVLITGPDHQSTPSCPDHSRLVHLTPPQCLWSHVSLERVHLSSFLLTSSTFYHHLCMRETLKGVCVN